MIHATCLSYWRQVKEGHTGQLNNGGRGFSSPPGSEKVISLPCHLLLPYMATILVHSTKSSEPKSLRAHARNLTDGG
jgi:hypothetical protein